MDISQQANLEKYQRFGFFPYHAEHMTMRIAMTTNQITLLPFGLGLTTTAISNVDRPQCSFTGTQSVQVYKILPKPAELSVDEMFAKLELKDLRAEAATEIGTKWVAETFLSKHPTKLSTLRMRAGLSQKELGKRLNVTQPMVAKWEKDDTPNLQLATIKNLANALSIDINALVDVLIGKNEEVNNDN